MPGRVAIGDIEVVLFSGHQRRIEPRVECAHGELDAPASDPRVRPHGRSRSGRTAWSRSSSSGRRVGGAGTGRWIRAPSALSDAPSVGVKAMTMMPLLSDRSLRIVVGLDVMPPFAQFQL